MQRSSQLLSAFALVLPLLAGCHSTPEPQTQVPSTVTGLAVGQAVVRTVPSTMQAVGSVHAAESTAVSAQLSGRVLAVLVHAGDAVRAGQPLVRIDSTLAASDLARSNAAVAAAQAAVAAAQSQSDLADSTLHRYQMLRDRKSISPQEFDEVSRRDQAAQAQLHAAASQLAAAQAAASSAATVAGYATVRAPYAGLVTARMADPGTLAAPGVPLLTVDRSGPLQLQVSVDESRIASVHVGQHLDATLNGQTVPTTVAEIVPAADPASHSFLVKLALPAAQPALRAAQPALRAAQPALRAAQPALRAGIYGSVAIPIGQRTAILIPSSAVVQRGSLATAWVLDANQIASLRYLTLGAAFGDQVEALSGIAAGDTLVLQPADRNLAGSRIQPANPAQPANSAQPASSAAEVRP